MFRNLVATDKFAAKHFDEIIDFLWEHKKEILLRDFGDMFEEPDYGGLPKRIIKGLSCDFVDAIQQAFTKLKMKITKNKREFARDCARYIYAN